MKRKRRKNSLSSKKGNAILTNATKEKKEPRRTGREAKKNPLVSKHQLSWSITFN